MRFGLQIATMLAILAPYAVTATEPPVTANPQGRLADPEPKPWKAGVAQVTITPEHLRWM